MFEKCSSCNETLTQSLTSRLRDDRANRPEKTKVPSIAAIDNGHMSGYGISLLYRRIRGRLSCQSAYRAPLINPRKRGLFHVTRCVRQSAFARVDFVSTFVLPFSCLLLSLTSFHYSLFPLFCLSRSSSFVLFFSFYLAHELKIFNLPNVDACSID